MKEATATALDEVVVTGTGTQKKITDEPELLPCKYKYPKNLYCKYQQRFTW